MIGLLRREYTIEAVASRGREDKFLDLICFAMHGTRKENVLSCVGIYVARGLEKLTKEEGLDSGRA